MKNTSKKDNLYHVESTSKSDLSGMAATDMTGLIPAAPETDDQLDSYKSLYPFSPEQYMEKPGQS